MRRTLFLIGVVVAAAFLVPILSVGRQKADEVNRDAIFANPQWQEKYDKYETKGDMIDALKPKLGSDMRIDVYLGLWCPDSRNNVPPFIKILDVAGSNVPVRYFGVPRKASRDVKYYVEEMQVERVPTFIFYRSGKEIGRIIENPKTGMLEDMLDIVMK